MLSRPDDLWPKIVLLLKLYSVTLNVQRLKIINLKKYSIRTGSVKGEHWVLCFNGFSFVGTERVYLEI